MNHLANRLDILDPASVRLTYPVLDGRLSMRKLLLIFGALTALSIPCVAQSEQPVESAPAVEPVTYREYQKHLETLQKLVADCEQNMSPDSCQPSRIGPDNQVQTPAGGRRVGYAWLRYTLDSASHVPAAKDPKGREQTVSLLQSAKERLTYEGIPDKEPSSNASLEPARRTLQSILSRNEFSQVKQPSWLERLRDTFLQWLGDRLQSVGRSSWSKLVRNLVLLSIFGIGCASLVWWFTRQVMRRNLSLSTNTLNREDAPSARDWQKWMEDASRHAEGGRWRNAIHDVYWGTISRLEASGLWPADRARTPREYLRLLAADDARLVDLENLTRSFERTWYGDQAAREEDFRHACVLLERLGSS